MAIKFLHGSTVNFLKWENSRFSLHRAKTHSKALRRYKRYTYAHIPNIDALKSDANTLRIQYEYTQKQCVGVAFEGIDIWYMGVT